MGSYVTVAVDAMGGDHAPEQIIRGVTMALNASDHVMVKLVGDEDLILRELAPLAYPKDRLEVIHASEVITNEEAPAIAIRRKKDSSIVVGQKLVHDGQADAFVSAGSTGAVLVGGQFVVGRIRGVERAPLAPLIPTTKGFSLLIDCGANVDARPSHLVQFARMGSIYMKSLMDIPNPTVAIVNIGAEEEKGNQLVKETFPLLKACDDINFIGSVEARDIPSGYADVVVCEAFTGNVILKMYEGVATSLVQVIKKGLMSSLPSKIGALLVKPALKKTLKAFDTESYGGAPMLGLNGLVVKSHGSSKAVEIQNAILQCVQFTEMDVTGKFRETLGRRPKPVEKAPERTEEEADPS